MSGDYYKTLLVSQSGCGKTMSARNLNRETTGFVNTENKPLPFKGAFKYHSRPKTLSETTATLIEYAKNPDIDTIFLDSLSAVFEMVLLDARKRYKGLKIIKSF